jgi:hypothetical protein
MTTARPYKAETAQDTSIGSVHSGTRKILTIEISTSPVTFFSGEMPDEVVVIVNGQQLCRVHPFRAEKLGLIAPHTR